MELHYHCPHCKKELSYYDRTCPYCGKWVPRIRLKSCTKTDHSFPLKKYLILLAVALVILLNLFQHKGDLLQSLHENKLVKIMEESNDNPIHMDIQYYDVPLSEAAGKDCSHFFEDLDARFAYMESLPEEQQDLFDDACFIMDDIEGVSRKGYIRQMRTKGYSAAEALDILPHLKINFQEEALKAALFTFSYDPSSKMEIQNILEFMMFEPEEIQFALDHCHPDYAQQAVMELRQFVKISELSPRNAKWRLEDQFYTPEEIQWAIENCGIDWDLCAYRQGVSHLLSNKGDFERTAEDLKNLGFEDSQVESAIEKLKNID